MALLISSIRSSSKPRWDYLLNTLGTRDYQQLSVDVNEFIWMIKHDTGSVEAQMGMPQNAIDALSNFIINPNRSTATKLLDDFPIMENYIRTCIFKLNFR